MPDRAIPSTEAEPRYARLVLWTVLLTGAILRLWRTTSGAFEGDEAFTLLARFAVLEHGAPFLPSGLLYPYGGVDLWYGAIGTAIGDLSVFWNRLPNALMGSLAPFVVARTLRRHAGVWAAIAGAVVVAWHPGHVEWSGHVKVYGVQTLFVALAIDCWLAWIVSDSRKALGCFVGWFALATTCHPNMGFMLPAFLALPLLQRPWQTLLRLPTVMVAVGVAVLPALWIVLLRHTDPTLHAQMVGDQSTSVRSILKGLWYGIGSHGWHSSWHAVPFVVMVVLTSATWWVTRGRDRISARLAWVGLLGWTSTWLALSLVSKHKGAMYLLPALPWMALSIGAAVAALVQWTRPSRRWMAAGAALAAVGVHLASTGDVWEQVLERRERPPLYDLIAEEAVEGELSLGGGSLPVLLSSFRLDDHMLYGREYGASARVVDGELVDRLFGNRFLPTPEDVAAALEGRPGAWYFVTDKELRYGRVSAELHEWLTNRMERVEGSEPGLHVYRLR